MTETQVRYKTDAQVEFEESLTPEEKARLALLYAEAQGDDFLEWSAKQVEDEQTPAHKDGWR